MHSLIHYIKLATSRIVRAGSLTAHGDERPFLAAGTRAGSMSRGRGLYTPPGIPCAYFEGACNFARI